MPEESEDESDPATPSNRHDSKHCAICKFFVQAKTLPVAIASLSQGMACGELTLPELDLVFHPLALAYLSRGPPLS
jgi:hypothetical protein